MSLKISLWSSTNEEPAKLDLLSQIVISQFRLDYLIQSKYGFQDFNKVVTLKFLEMVHYLDNLDNLLRTVSPEDKLGIVLKMNTLVNAPNLKLFEVRPRQNSIALIHGNTLASYKKKVKNAAFLSGIPSNVAGYIHDLGKYFLSIYNNHPCRISKGKLNLHKMYFIIEGDLDILKGYLTQNQLQNSFSKPKPLTEAANNNKIASVTKHNSLFS